MSIFICTQKILKLSCRSCQKGLLVNGYGIFPRKFDFAAYKYLLNNPSVILQGYKITLIISLAATAWAMFIQTMFVTGFWHGAGWNFIVWGLFFGVLLVLSIILGNLFSLLSGFMMTMISSELNKKQIPVTLPPP